MSFFDEQQQQQQHTWTPFCPLIVMLQQPQQQSHVCGRLSPLEAPSLNEQRLIWSWLQIWLETWLTVSFSLFECHMRADESHHFGEEVVIQTGSQSVGRLDSWAPLLHHFPFLNMVDCVRTVAHSVPSCSCARWWKWRRVGVGGAGDCWDCVLDCVVVTGKQLQAGWSMLALFVHCCGYRCFSCCWWWFMDSCSIGVLTITTNILNTLDRFEWRRES